jgi:copper chaperone CopZ
MTIRNTLSLAAILFALAVAPAALADSVTYEMAASGVSCAGSAARAENAVRSAGEVESVKADPATQSVTATFDDDEVELASIVESLEAAGMSVGEPMQVQ